MKCGGLLCLLCGVRKWFGLARDGWLAQDLSSVWGLKRVSGFFCALG